jgi:transcription elongation factor, greA/greB, C-term
MNTTTYLSKKGFKELHKQINELEIREKALSAELRDIGRAKSRDDKLRRSDIIMNLENVHGKLTEKRTALKTAKPLPRKRDRLRIAIGSVVDLIDQQGQLFRYTLVDSLEADPSDGRISVDSPLGQSLLNRHATETISLGLGRTTRRLQVVGVR